MRTFILDLIEYLQNDFSATEWGAFLLPLKILSASLSVGLVLVIVYILVQMKMDLAKNLEMIAESIDDKKAKKATEDISDEGPKKVSSEGWQSVLDKLESGNEDSFKQAVIEADKMFDDLLKRTGYQGEDMGERLRQITPDQLGNINEVWEAHKMRNRLVHEPDFELREHEARRMIEIYGRALQDLKAI